MIGEHIFEPKEADDEPQSKPEIELARRILGDEATPERIYELTDTRPLEYVSPTPDAVDDSQ